MLLLHHVGAKSGAERVAPLVYFADDGRYVIFASKGGAPENPAWYHNLMAHPETKVEVGERDDRGRRAARPRARSATGSTPRRSRAHAAVRRVPGEDDPQDPGDRADAQGT